jgi:GntR family transcriptional repressor for pyruvate dehydrogenase complex
VEHISGSLQASITLLSASRDLSLEDLLEVRELLEVPAARLAAQRRTDEDLDTLAQSIPSDPLSLAAEHQFDHNRAFHSSLITVCANPLLTIAATPIFSVLQTNLARAGIGDHFHTAINEHHLAIAAAVRARSPRVAEREMRSHLAFLRPFYEKAWRETTRAA